jgi:hypothetical protein
MALYVILYSLSVSTFASIELEGLRGYVTTVPSGPLVWA